VKSTRKSLGRPREQRVHRDLDPRREHAADVLAIGRDDVEVRRRPEVDDDRGRPVALLHRDRVRDPVGADLSRIVVPQRDAGADARTEHERRQPRAVREPLVLAHERRNGRREADAVHDVEVEQRRDEHIELVRRRAALGRDAVVLGEPGVVEHAVDRLRVADVDG
jgi:hypothetical protein